MIPTASLTLLSLIASIGLVVTGWGSPVAAAHLAFAVGIIPLIFAAMMHFVPVLTRTGDPGPGARRLPMLAQCVGLLAVAGMQGWLPHFVVSVAALADLVLAGTLLSWIAQRVRMTLGTPHPGWRWYGVALGCLILALGAIALMPVWPSYWQDLRGFHLHLNTLGLVGMAALGTLPVLLPTAVGQPDPEAAGWLRRRLWLVAFGALMVATGAVVNWAFAVPGAALLLVAMLGLIGQWARRFGMPVLLRDGVAANLLAAMAGLMLTLIAGVMHGAGLLAARPSLYAWAAGFLLPLVTGALSQLLPVWRWPGPVTAERLAMRRKLAASGVVRAALFFGATLALVAGDLQFGVGLAMAAMLLFLIGVVQAVRVSRSTR